MKFFIYILKSLRSGKFYTGCSANPQQRFLEHFCNKTCSTKHRGPWKLTYTEEYPDKKSALKRERQIKKWKSHKAIEALIRRGVEQPGSSLGS